MVYCTDQLKPEIGAQSNKSRLRGRGLGLGLGVFMLAACGSVHSEDAGEQGTETQQAVSTSTSSLATKRDVTVTDRFDKIIDEFNSNEVAASLKYANARIRTEDYVSAIHQDGDGAYASLDGGINAYGTPEMIATLHRGDEIRVTCDSPSKSAYLNLKNCDLQVLHPVSGFDDEIGGLAIGLDSKGGAATAKDASDQADADKVSNAMGNVTLQPFPSIGTCYETSIHDVDLGSGTAVRRGVGIVYTNGRTMLQFGDVIAKRWLKGDHVKMCVVSVPQNCPPDSDHSSAGVVYQVRNLRTGDKWKAADSDKSCYQSVQN